MIKKDLLSFGALYGIVVVLRWLFMGPSSGTAYEAGQAGGAAFGALVAAVCIYTLVKGGRSDDEKGTPPKCFLGTFIIIY